jgi:hypothetical protein
LKEQFKLFGRYLHLGSISSTFARGFFAQKNSTFFLASGNWRTANGNWQMPFAGNFSLGEKSLMKSTPGLTHIPLS